MINCLLLQVSWPVQQRIKQSKLLSSLIKQNKQNQPNRQFAASASDSNMAYLLKISIN